MSEEVKPRRPWKGTHKYNPDIHPQQLVEMMQEGKGKAEFCADINISPSTFYHWVNKHDEFGNAYGIGKAKLIAYFSRMLRENLGNQKANSAIFKMYSNVVVGLNLSEPKESNDRRQNSNADEETVKRIRSRFVKNV